MKSTTVRIYQDDVPELRKLRFRLSVLLGRDVTAAEAIRWLLGTNEAQRVIRGEPGE